MLTLLKTPIGRLLLLGYVEGLSLLVLLFIAVPLKYAAENPSLSKITGPTHGALFLLFIINTLSVGVEQAMAVQKNDLQSPIGVYYSFWHLLYRP